VQRHDPGVTLRAGQGVIGDVGIALIDVDLIRWPAVSATTRYTLGSSVWHQRWEAVVLDDDATTDALMRSGLDPISMEDQWVLAAHATHTP
jgi:hypothetical protein